MDAARKGPKPVELLMSDHKMVQGKLDRLDEILLSLEEDPASIKDTDVTYFREILNFFDTDLGVHFRREEDVLFSFMEKYVPRDMGPIGIMLEEHVKILEGIEEFKESIKAFATTENPAEAEAENLMFNGRLLIELLRNHIDKEDNVLLPMAEEYLSELEWNLVMKGMEKIALDRLEKRQ